MKRFIDIILSFIGILILAVPFVIIYSLVRWTSPGPAIHWSKRIGKNNQLFFMPKFRSMFIQAPQVATHLLMNSDALITPLGKILRQISLDEIPQLYSVLIGDMSLVGPRPALFNQADLIKLRTEKGIQILQPGVTGWAQVNGRDDLPIPIKVEYDFYYLNNKNIRLDFQILFLTVFKVLKSEGVKH